MGLNKLLGNPSCRRSVRVWVTQVSAATNTIRLAAVAAATGLLLMSPLSAVNAEGVVIDDEWLANHPHYRARVAVQERFAGDPIGGVVKIFGFSFGYLDGIQNPAYCAIESVTVFDDCDGELGGITISNPTFLTNEDKRELVCTLENYDDENVRLTAIERPGSEYQASHHVLIPKANRTALQEAVGYSGSRTFYIGDRVLMSTYEPIRLERDRVGLTRFKLDCDLLLLPTVTGGEK
jgi:hypothetical protein